MKKLLFLILFIPVLSFGQNIKLDTVTNDYKYDTVYTSPLGKEALFAKLQGWAMEHFVCNVNKEASEISFTNSTQVDYQYFPGKDTQGRLLYECRIYVKDKKFRVIISPITLERIRYTKELGVRMSYMAGDGGIKAVAKSADHNIKATLANLNSVVNGKGEADF